MTRLPGFTRPVASSPAALMRTRGPRMKPSETRSGSVRIAARTSNSSLADLQRIAELDAEPRHQQRIDGHAVAAVASASAHRPGPSRAQARAPVERVAIVGRLHLDERALPGTGSHGAQGRNPAQDPVAGKLAHLLAGHLPVNERRTPYRRRAAAGPPRRAPARPLARASRRLAMAATPRMRQTRKMRKPPTPERRLRSAIRSGRCHAITPPARPGRRATRRCGGSGGRFQDRGSPAAASVPSRALKSKRRSRICPPVAWSRLPVGSSARMMRTPAASARAMATRCCSPPESSPG